MHLGRAGHVIRCDAHSTCGAIQDPSMMQPQFNHVLQPIIHSLFLYHLDNLLGSATFHVHSSSGFPVGKTFRWLPNAEHDSPVYKEDPVQ
jgi:hypothetical protein